MAGDIGDELNLAVGEVTVKLNSIYANKDMHVLCTYIRIKLKRAHILYVGRRE